MQIVVYCLSPSINESDMAACSRGGSYFILLIFQKNRGLYSLAAELHDENVRSINMDHHIPRPRRWLPPALRSKPCWN
jgi:hypothetical protein